MKELKKELKSLAKALKALARQTEKMEKKLDKLEKALRPKKKAPTKVTKKKVVKRTDRIPDLHCTEEWIGRTGLYYCE